MKRNYSSASENEKLYNSDDAHFCDVIKKKTGPCHKNNPHNKFIAIITNSDAIQMNFTIMFFFYVIYFVLSANTHKKNMNERTACDRRQ